MEPKGDHDLRQGRHDPVVRGTFFYRRKLISGR